VAAVLPEDLDSQVKKLRIELRFKEAAKKYMEAANIYKANAEKAGAKAVAPYDAEKAIQRMCEAADCYHLEGLMAFTYAKVLEGVAQNDNRQGRIYERQAKQHKTNGESNPLVEPAREDYRSAINDSKHAQTSYQAAKESLEGAQNLFQKAYDSFNDSAATMRLAAHINIKLRERDGETKSLRIRTRSIEEDANNKFVEINSATKKIRIIDAFIQEEEKLERELAKLIQ